MLWCALTELIGGLTSERALCLPRLIFSLFILYQPERQKHLTDIPQTCIVFPKIFTLWCSNPAQNLTTSSILNIKYLLPAEEVVCFPLTSENYQCIPGNGVRYAHQSQVITDPYHHCFSTQSPYLWQDTKKDFHCCGKDSSQVCCQKNNM